MSEKQSIDLRQIVLMEVLQMSIEELSTRLRSMAADCSCLAFSTDSASRDSYDACLRGTESGFILEINEPSIGTAYIDTASDVEPSRRLKAEWFVQSIDTRRLLLYRLTEQLLECFPAIPTQGVYGTIKMADLAMKCDIPLTTVSRLLAGKKLMTESGLILYRDFCDDSKGRRSPT